MRMNRREVLPIACIALAGALVIAPVGFAQSSFYILAKALTHGTPRIDDTHWWSIDISWWDGHYYSNKAPGLAFLVAPLALALHALGLQPGNPVGDVQSLEASSGVDALAIWPLTLLGATAAAFVLLLLVRSFAERVDPGYGTAAAVTLGAGTMVLPFSILLFDHVLAAMLAFAGFALLWHERHREQRLALVVCGGLAAGLAVTAEYPSGLVAVI